MIEFEYELVRDEGDEVRTYFPDKLSSPFKSSTTYIEAPNSTGKSTLLHLIALGFHGLDSTDLPSSLREKIEDLIDNDKIVFDIRIRDKAGKVILQASKDHMDKDTLTTSHDIGNGLETIDSSTFRDNYKVIYDIPDDPTRRIEKLADEVKYYQTGVSNNLSLSHNYVRDILTEITEGRDPKRISKIQGTIAGEKSNLVMLKNQRITDQKNFDFACRYAFPKLLEGFTTELTSIDSELSRVRSKVKSRMKTKDTSKTKYDTAVKNANSIIQQAHGEYRNSSTYLKSLFSEGKHGKLYRDKWLKLDFVEMRTTHSLSGDIVAIIEEFRSLCNDIYQENKSAEQTSMVYAQFIDTLKEVLEKNIALPEIGISIKGFIEGIEKLSEKTRSQAHASKNARDVIGGLDRLITFLNNLEREQFPKLRRLSTEASGASRSKINAAEISRIEKSLLRRRNEIKAKVEEYKYKCTSRKIPQSEHTKLLRENRKSIEKYIVYTEDQLAKEMVFLEDELKKSKKQFELLEIKVKRDKKELERLENQKPHQYEKKKDAIENIMSFLGSLERKFLNAFGKALDSYRSKKALPNKSNFPKEFEMTEAYYDGVSNFLGTKLGTIRHIDREYVVTKVDLVAGNVTTEEGKNIRLKSMGTGQTQSTYLQSRLKTDYGGKKLIVMFDEVGAMDAKSIEPIKTTIKKLKADGTLLVGLVVQRLDSGVKVTPI